MTTSMATIGRPAGSRARTAWFLHVPRPAVALRPAESARSLPRTNRTPVPASSQGQSSEDLTPGRYRTTFDSDRSGRSRLDSICGRTPRGPICRRRWGRTPACCCPSPDLGRSSFGARGREGEATMVANRTSGLQRSWANSEERRVLRSGPISARGQRLSQFGPTCSWDKVVLLLHLRRPGVVHLCEVLRPPLRRLRPRFASSRTLRAPDSNPQPSPAEPTLFELDDPGPLTRDEDPRERQEVSILEAHDLKPRGTASLKIGTTCHGSTSEGDRRHFAGAPRVTMPAAHEADTVIITNPAVQPCSSVLHGGLGRSEVVGSVLGDRAAATRSRTPR